MVKPAWSEQGTVQTVWSVCGSYYHHIFVANFLTVRLESRRGLVNKKSCKSLHIVQQLQHKNFKPSLECSVPPLPPSAGSSLGPSSPRSSGRLHPSRSEALTGDASVCSWSTDRMTATRPESRSHQGTGCKERRHGPGERAALAHITTSNQNLGEMYWGISELLNRGVRCPISPRCNNLRRTLTIARKSSISMSV